MGTPTTTKTISETSRMESTGQAGPRMNGTGERYYSFLFTKARF